MRPVLYRERRKPNRFRPLAGGGTTSAHNRFASIGPLIMKRVLLSLLLVAGVLYAAHAFFSAGDSRSSGGEPSAGTSEGPNEAAPAKTDDAKAPEATQALTAEAMAPSPANSRHAIAVEQAPSPAEASSGSAATPPSADAELQHAAFMKVTSPASIREGPSTSAAIIGVAQPGAEAQIVSRSTDWVEIIDPGSKKTGWIHESFLAPQAEPASRPVPPEELASLAETENAAADDDQQTSLKSKSRKHASRHRHRRHSIVLGPFILRFR